MKLGIFTYVDGTNDTAWPSSEAQKYIGEYTYQAARMGDCTLTATLKSMDCLDSLFTLKEYVTYEGERFYITKRPQAKKDNSSLTYTYDLTFVPERDVLKSTYMMDVPDDIDNPTSGIFYTMTRDILFAGDINELAKKINYSIKYSGWGEYDYTTHTGTGWYVIVDSGITSDTAEVSLSSATIMDAVKKSFEIFEIPYYFSGTVIHFGNAENTIAMDLGYGLGNGLVSVTKSPTGDGIVTSATGTGSSENISFYYPNHDAGGTAVVTHASSNLVGHIMDINASVVKGLQMSTGELTMRFYNRSSLNKTNFANYGITYKIRENKTVGGVTTNVWSDCSEDEYTYISGTYSGDTEVGTTISDTTYRIIDASMLIDSTLRLNTAFRVTIANDWVIQEIGAFRTKTMTIFVADTLTDEQLAADTIDTSSLTYVTAPSGFDMGGHKYLVVISSTLHIPEYLEEYEDNGGGIQYRPYGYNFNIRTWMQTEYLATEYKGHFTMSQNGQWRGVTYEKSGIVFDDYTAIANFNEASDISIIKIDGFTWIMPQDKLMPPMYTRGDGTLQIAAGRRVFYDAINNKYPIPDSSPVTYYTFQNEEEFPRKHYESVKDYDDIKPSIKGMTNADDARIDIPVSFAYDDDDDDSYTETESGEKTYNHPYFYMKLHKTDGDYAFNLFNQAIEDSTAKVHLTSGTCGACEFEIMVAKIESGNHYIFKNPTQVVYDTATQTWNLASGNYNTKVISGRYQSVQQDTRNNEVWITLKKDLDTFGTMMPSADWNYKPSVNDTFVITGIRMPQSYIDYAEDVLYENIIKDMHDNNVEHFTYDLSLSRIFYQQNIATLSALSENSLVSLVYNGITLSGLYVSNYSYKTDGNCIPQIDLTLTESATMRSHKWKSIWVTYGGGGSNNTSTSGKSVVASNMVECTQDEYMRMIPDKGTEYFIRDTGMIIKNGLSYAGLKYADVKFENPFNTLYLYDCAGGVVKHKSLTSIGNYSFHINSDITFTQSVSTEIVGGVKVEQDGTYLVMFSVVMYSNPYTTKSSCDIEVSFGQEKTPNITSRASLDPLSYCTVSGCSTVGLSKGSTYKLFGYSAGGRVIAKATGVKYYGKSTSLILVRLS
jgi:hypothetical protein